MSAKQTVRDRPPRVLVVEHDPAIAKMLRFSLRAAGFDVAAVTAGAEALNILKEQGATDAVVLDIGLPDGLGKAIIDRLRQTNELDRPVWVVISALDRDEAAGRYGPLGSHFLGKPFDPWDLIRMLEKLLEARRERNGASPADTPKGRTP